MARVLALAFRRERGMTSLQAVILLGAGFLVVWGLMELFEGNKGTASGNVALTLRGKFKRPQGGGGGGGGRPPGGANPGNGGNGAANPGDGTEPPGGGETEEIPEGRDVSELGSGELLWGLYAQTLTPEERDELDRRLNSNIFSSLIFFLQTAEIEVQRNREIHDTGDRLWATGIGAAGLILDLTPAKPVAAAKRVGTGGRAAVRGVNAARRLKLPHAVDAFRKEYKQLGGRYADLKKNVELLEKKYPELKGQLQVHHVPPHSATEIPFDDGPAMVMYEPHHRRLPTSRNDQDEIDAIREAWERNRKEGVRVAREEIDNMLERLEQEHGATAHGPLREAYDQGYFEALVYLFGGRSK